MNSTFKLSLLFACIFFVIGLVTLPAYGINWDTINHLPRGQAYLHYYLTGSRDYSNLPGDSPDFPWYWQNPRSLGIDTDVPKTDVPQRSIYQVHGATFTHFMEHDGVGHPPLSDILSSAFNIVLFSKLRLINDVDSYRVYGVFLASALIGLVFWWASSVYGRFAVSSPPYHYRYIHFFGQNHTLILKKTYQKQCFGDSCFFRFGGASLKKTGGGF